MKRNLLYIGNKLKHKNSNISTIDILGGNLEREDYKLFYASSFTNKVLRLQHMLYSCVKHRNRIDFVLIDTYSTLNFYYAFFVSQLCGLLGLKYIPILHGGNLPSRLKTNPKLSSSIFNNAYKIVSPSLYLKKSFEDHSYSNIHYLPNTISIAEYPFRQRKIDEINMLWVRSLSKIYNPNLAIQVLNILRQKGYKANLCMVGPDSDKMLHELKILAKNFNLKVTFTGKLSKEEWIKLSENYNIFLNTTNFDNMPVSVIEAMALGLPIVSTDVGGMPHLISNEEDGLLVERDNADKMVEAILKLKEDNDLVKKVTRNARRKVEQFDWETVKHLWFKLLD